MDPGKPPAVMPAARTQLREPTGLGMVFVGCVSEGYRSLAYLLQRGERILCAFTLAEDLAAKTSGALPFDEITGRHGVPLVKVRNINDPEHVEEIHRLAPDLLLVIGWTQLVKAPILRIPRLGCLGFHASLLPRYRGRAPVNWAMIHGEEKTGNTLIVLEEGADTGDIVAQREIPILFEDTCGSVYDRVAESEIEMLDEVLPLIREGRMPRRKQDASLATVMPKRRPEDGLIDWNLSWRKVYDWVRALTHPYPGAFSWLEHRKVTLWKVSPAETADSTLAPGEICWQGDRLLAGTGGGLLRLDRLQAEGNSEASGPEFARRYVPRGRARMGGPPNEEKP